LGESKAEHAQQKCGDLQLLHLFERETRYGSKHGRSFGVRITHHVTAAQHSKPQQENEMKAGRKNQVTKKPSLLSSQYGVEFSFCQPQSA